MSNALEEAWPDGRRPEIRNRNRSAPGDDLHLGPAHRGAHAGQAVAERDRQDTWFLRDAPFELAIDRSIRRRTPRRLLARRASAASRSRSDSHGEILLGREPLRISRSRTASSRCPSPAGDRSRSARPGRSSTVVQTQPNRSVEPPAPRFLSCACTCDPVALSAGSTPRIAAPTTVARRHRSPWSSFRPGSIQNGRPRSARVVRGHAPLQCPMRGGESDDRPRPTRARALRRRAGRRSAARLAPSACRMAISARAWPCARRSSVPDVGARDEQDEEDRQVRRCANSSQNRSPGDSPPYARTRGRRCSWVCGEAAAAR